MIITGFVHGVNMKDNDKNETTDQKEWSKSCINCDAYGYKTKNDYKYGRKFCFTHKVYINKPVEIVCVNWVPFD